MSERRNTWKTVGRSLLCALLILSVLTGGLIAAAEGPKSLKAEMDAKNIEKYGNLVLSLTCKEMLDAGYQYGDVVSVSFLDKTMDLPFCSDYTNVDVGDPVIVARSVDTYVKIAVYLGDFASTYGLAVKSVAEDQSVSWSYAEGVQGPVSFTISLKEAGGYYEEYLAHNLTYTNARSDYPQLTDEQFANFRVVSTSGMGKNLLCRTASPVNPQYNRNSYADAAIKKAGVTVIVNLADDEDTLQSFAGYAGTYYRAGKDGGGRGGRFEDRDLPRLRTGRPARQHLGHGGPDHAPAERGLGGRERGKVADAEPGARAPAGAGETASRRGGAARFGKSGNAARPLSSGARRRGPHVQGPAAGRGPVRRRSTAGPTDRSSRTP